MSANAPPVAASLRLAASAMAAAVSRRTATTGRRELLVLAASGAMELWQLVLASAEETGACFTLPAVGASAAVVVLKDGLFFSLGLVPASSMSEKEGDCEDWMRYGTLSCFFSHVFFFWLSRKRLHLRQS